MKFASSSACLVRTGSSRSCRTTASSPSGFTRRGRVGGRASNLTTAWFITQTGTLPRHRRCLRRSEGRACVMSEDLISSDDQSHYEISLTAGQAFLAFVLLLLSLAASFAFGLMIGKGQADERLVVRKEPAVIQEGAASGSKKSSHGRLLGLGLTPG